jgi:hypothetical protein
LVDFHLLLFYLRLFRAQCRTQLPNDSLRLFSLHLVTFRTNALRWETPRTQLI